MRLWILQADDQLPFRFGNHEAKALGGVNVPCIDQRASRIATSRSRDSTSLLPKIGLKRRSTSEQRQAVLQRNSRYVELAQHRFLSFTDILRSFAFSKLLSSVCLTLQEAPENARYYHDKTSSFLPVTDASGAARSITWHRSSVLQPTNNSIKRLIKNKFLDRTYTIVLPPSFVNDPANRTSGEGLTKIDLTKFLLNLPPNAVPIIKQADPIAFVDRMLPVSIIPPGARFVAACFWSWLCVIDGMFPCSYAVH